MLRIPIFSRLRGAQKRSGTKYITEEKKETEMAMSDYITNTVEGSWLRTSTEVEELRQRAMAQMVVPPTPDFYRRPLGSPFGSPPPPNKPPENTLVLIKKSIKEIKAEAVSEEAQGKIQTKIDRLLDAGALAQATILETELQVRVKLMRVQEWDYKVLPYEAIKEYESANKNWDGIGGRYKVHIDLLESYCGTIEAAEAKDKIIPDGVLDEIEKAKDQKVFDKLSVLWVEKIPDPLLLGSIDGCKDFFLIAQWGKDVTFEDLVGPKEKDGNKG